MNVQNGGGRAALIYNNVSGGFQGTLGEGNSSTIIALGLSLEDGQYLAANNIGSTATVSSSVVTPASGYEAWSGTSMATPHVSAAAALVWSCLPTATNVQVRNALTSTALDLGTAGRDVHYGYGLVQAKIACFSLNPTAVELKSFTAVGSQKSVTLRWETVSESDNLGFNLYRSRAVDGKKTKVNRELIPTQTYPGSSIGASYKFWDRPLIPQMTYFYWLEDVDIYGRTELHGPIKVKTLQLKK